MLTQLCHSLGLTPNAAVLRRWLLIAALGIVAVALGACGGGSTDTADNETGDVVIALTDAPGDFLSYTVDVVSLKLTRADGTVVETLPLTTRVDFAEYTELTEFLTAATIPSGIYVKSTMQLDYSAADIWVEDESGEPVQVEQILDTNGAPVGVLEVSVRLEDRNSLRITPGIPAHLTLDFDLKASNTVVFEAGQPVQTVEPFLLADVLLESPKPHRLRGALKSVDVVAQNFAVILRPFYRPLSDTGERFGSLTVTSTTDTVYDIDGASYTGAGGLLALDTLPTFAATVVVGEIKREPLRFEATEVYAGSSVPGGNLDAVRGNVVARADNVVTLKGATLIRDDGSVVFRDAVTVRVGETTMVKRQLSLEEFDIDDISVGQRLWMLGTLTNRQPGELELDASEGYARMLLTTLRGTLADNDLDVANPLLMALQLIDGRPVTTFDFTGTGTEPVFDADPSTYEIDTGSLNLAGLAPGTPIAVRGFVRPFGQAPADFEAHSVVEVSAAPATALVNWVPPTETPFATSSASVLTLNLDQTGGAHYLIQRGIRTDLLEAPLPLSLMPQASGEGLYWVAEDGIIQLHTSFGDFVAAIEARVADGGTVSGLRADGAYDADSVTMTTARIAVRID